MTSCVLKTATGADHETAPDPSPGAPDPDHGTPQSAHRDRLPAVHDRSGGAVQHRVSSDHGLRRAGLFLYHRRLLDADRHVHAGVRGHHLHERYRETVLHHRAGVGHHPHHDRDAVYVHPVRVPAVDRGIQQQAQAALPAVRYQRPHGSGGRQRHLVERGPQAPAAQLSVCHPRTGRAARAGTVRQPL